MQADYLIYSNWNFRETVPSIHQRSDILVLGTEKFIVLGCVGYINENDCITEFLGTENEACDVDQSLSDV